MLVYEKPQQYGYVYEMYPYGGFFSAIGSFFSKIGHGISSIFHKIGSVFSTAPAKISSTPTTGVIKVGSQIGGGAYSILEGETHASSLAKSISSGGFGSKAWSEFNKKLASNLLGMPSSSSSLGGWAKNPFATSIKLGEIGVTTNVGAGTNLFSKSLLSTANILEKSSQPATTKSGGFLADILKQLALTTTQTLIQAGQIKLQQEIAKQLGLAPKRPTVIPVPVPVQTYRPQQPVVTYQPTQPTQPIQHTPSATTKPHTQVAATQVKQQVKQQKEGAIAGIPNEYLLLGAGGLLLLLYLLND